MCVLTSDSHVRLHKATLHSGPCPDTREKGEWLQPSPSPLGSDSNEKHCKDELLGYGSLAQRLSGMCEALGSIPGDQDGGEKIDGRREGPFCRQQLPGFFPLRT